MKRTGVLFLMILLLSGCGLKPGPDPAVIPPETQSPQAAESLRRLEEAPRPADGNLEVFSLERACCLGLKVMGEDLLIISREEDALFLWVIRGKDARLLAQTSLTEDILAPDALLQILPEGVSWFRVDTKERVVLNTRLEEICQVTAPEGLTGTSVFSPDGRTLYYCTQEDIRALELESGISRILKTDPTPDKTLGGIFMEGTVLRCDYEDPHRGPQCRFLSTETGQLLREGAPITLQTEKGRYYSTFPNGSVSSWVFGDDPQSPELLLPAEKAEQCFFLPHTHRALTLDREEGGWVLTCYSLSEGRALDRLVFPGSAPPEHAASTPDGSIWLAAKNSSLLYRWTPRTDSSGTKVTLPYHSAEAPDINGLERCGDYAAELGKTYGIEILVWKDAAAIQTWDRCLEPEHQVHILWEALEKLDSWLARYPEGFLKELAGRGTGLKICLVREITGSPESPDPESVIPFWLGTDSYLILPIGEGCETALYHGLSHLIDTAVLGRSSAYDSWDSLNPGDFTYDYDYETNATRESPQFLRDHSRSFIDTYSMSFPVEDRARIMEYAMTPGNQALFDAPILQEKLRRICVGIREAFSLEEHPLVLPWEKYLHTPLLPH